MGSTATRHWAKVGLRSRSYIWQRALRNGIISREGKLGGPRVQMHVMWGQLGKTKTLYPGEEMTCLGRRVGLIMAILYPLSFIQKNDLDQLVVLRTFWHWVAHQQHGLFHGEVDPPSLEMFEESLLDHLLGWCNSEDSHHYPELQLNLIWEGSSSRPALWRVVMRKLSRPPLGSAGQ